MSRVLRCTGARVQRCLGVLGALSVLAIAATAGLAAPSGPPTPVLVELFTSEGCSSCPPADELLQKLADLQPVAGARVIALGEHVDYWDHLGWKDRFSSAALTARQQRYGQLFNTEAIYTPQMVVDGREQFVGSDASSIRQAIGKAAVVPHGLLNLTIEPSGADRVAVAVTASALSQGSRGDVVVALTEDQLRSDVKRGENHGRTLSHAAVVRAIATVGTAAGGSASARGEIPVAPDWARIHLTIVAFVQDRGNGRVLAASAIPLVNSTR